MADILIMDFPMSLNGRWGVCSDHIVIHGNGSVTYTDGHNVDKAKAVQVVRCKNCKHHSYDEIFGGYWCEHPGMAGEVKPDFYCAYGGE